LEPPDAAALASLQDAKTRAEAARQRAFDFDGPRYLVQDWNAAESQYVLAGEQEQFATLGELNESVALYKNAADAFDRIFDAALPLYAQDLRDEIIEARTAAITAGIEDASPDRLEAADDTADDALRLYEEEKDYYPAVAAALQALDMYQVLKTGVEAYHVRMEIIDRDFSKYDLDNFVLADTLGLDALEAYDSQDIDAALEGAEEAQLRYNLVLSTAWQAYAAERRAAAGVERQTALDLKANVAVKNDFEAANGVFNQAEASLRAQRHSDAVDLYFQSEYMFAAVSGIAAEKRRLAEEAIRQAEEKAAASDAVAQQADVILEGGTQ
jgi:hypothetical protein